MTKIIRKYTNNNSNVKVTIKKIINELFNFIIINILGKNPKNGGNPPKDKKLEKKNNLINLLFNFKL